MSRQKLGQHFLRSAGILERIAAAACPEPGELVVEVGPGRGALTEYLLRRAGRVATIELDRELADGLRARWANEPRFSLLEGDALHTDWHQWGPGTLAGNLPYYVASAIITRYLKRPGSLTQGVFLIQKEVADRITAQPGSRDYGFLSVECQSLAEAKLLFRVPPGAFSPPPKVESAVILLTPRHPPSTDAESFLAFASHCFRQKRKTLRNNLVGHYDAARIADLPEAGNRAEQLSIPDLRRIHRRLTGEEAQPQNQSAPANT